MKIALVDGALGHTGSFLVKNLLEEGWKVVATDLKSEDRDKIMTKEKIFGFDFERLDCREWSDVTYIAADLIKKETLKELVAEEIFLEGKKNYDAIFHTASLYDYVASYELLHLVNYDGLKNLLEVIFEYSKESRTDLPRFIHWSTCGVYGEPLYQKDRKGYIYPIDEAASYNPPNNYSQTKVEQEKLLFKTAREHPEFRYTIIRPAPIYGPYQTYGMYQIFYTACIMGHSILPKIFPKNKKLMMPYIHVEDLAKAAIFLAEKKEAIGEAYNVLNDSPLQEDWLECVYNEVGISFTTIPLPSFLYKVVASVELYIAKRKEKKAKRYGIRPKFDVPMVEYLTHQYYFSNKKIKNLGFQFKYNDFRREIFEIIKWYEERGWFPSLKYEAPEYINSEPKNPVQSKEEYKTPMEGGVIF